MFDPETIYKLGFCVRHADMYCCIFSHLCCDQQHQWEFTPWRMWRLVYRSLAPNYIIHQTPPSFFPPPHISADERIWSFKSGGGWAKIHDGLITLSVVKLKLYIQSIGFMMPLQHLIEIKCQNAWWPWASSDGNQALDESNLDSPLSVYKTFIWFYNSVYW